MRSVIVVFFREHFIAHAFSLHQIFVRMCCVQDMHETVRRKVLQVNSGNDVLTNVLRHFIFVGINVSRWNFREVSQNDEFSKINFSFIEIFDFVILNNGITHPPPNPPIAIRWMHNWFLQFSRSFLEFK